MEVMTLKDAIAWAQKESQHYAVTDRPGLTELHRQLALWLDELRERRRDFGCPQD